MVLPHPLPASSAASVRTMSDAQQMQRVPVYRLTFAVPPPVAFDLSQRGCRYTRRRATRIDASVSRNLQGLRKPETPSRIEGLGDCADRSETDAVSSPVTAGEIAAGPC